MLSDAEKDSRHELLRQQTTLARFGELALTGLWRFLMGGGHACKRIRPALLTFESDAFHCFRSHGGAIDADRKARITGKIVALKTL